MSNSEWHNDQAIGERALRLSKKVLLGFFIRRTPKRPPHPGETLHARTYVLYATREQAEAALPHYRKDADSTLDVAEAWTTLKDSEGT